MCQRLHTFLFQAIDGASGTILREVEFVPRIEAGIGDD